MANQETTTSGLKLALEFIDSKLARVKNQYKSTYFNGKFSNQDEKAQALARVYGADMALSQVRERIVRAIGPDAE